VRVVSLLALATLASRCENANNRPSSVAVGRVVSIDGAKVCVTEDRGESRRCATFPDRGAMAGVDVGECAVLAIAETGAASKVEVVDDAECVDADFAG
jgi:hypothetical protein